MLLFLPCFLYAKSSGRCPSKPTMYRSPVQLVFAGVAQNAHVLEYTLTPEEYHRLQALYAKYNDHAELPKLLFGGSLYGYTSAREFFAEVIAGAVHHPDVYQRFVEQRELRSAGFTDLDDFLYGVLQPTDIVTDFMKMEK